MANSEIIGAGQDASRPAPEDEEKCTDTKCYYYGAGRGIYTGKIRKQ